MPHNVEAEVRTEGTLTYKEMDRESAITKLRSGMKIVKGKWGHVKCYSEVKRSSLLPSYLEVARYLNRYGKFYSFAKKLCIKIKLTRFYIMQYTTVGITVPNC